MLHFVTYNYIKYNNKYNNNVILDILNIITSKNQYEYNINYYVIIMI